MNGFWIGVTIGLLIFPVLFALIPGCFGIPKAKYLKYNPIKPNLPISDRLRKEIKKSLIPTNELSWINVILQRLYFDTIRNYYFEHRIKQNIMKSFSSVIGDGLLKNVKITGLNFGVEAPFLKTVRLITQEEYRRILKIRKCDSKLCEDEISRNLNKVGLSSIANDVLSSSIANTENTLLSSDLINTEILPTNSIYENESISLSSSVNLNNNILLNDKATKPDEANSNSSQHIDFDQFNIKCADAQDIYKNATFLGRFEFDSAIQIMIEIELPHGICANSTITLKKIHSDFLFRTPAEYHNTRCEICLINNPDIEMDVQSGLVTGDKKLYFQNSISNLLKRTAISTIKKMFMFPSWFQMAQPMVPSTKLADFTPIYFDLKNESLIENHICDFEKILLTMSTDFSIVEYKNEIIFKRSHFLLNNLEYVYCWCFKAPKTFKLPGSENFSFFEGLNSTESKILHSFESIEILKKIFPIERFQMLAKKRNISLISIETFEKKFEVLRMVYKNNVLFLRNDPKMIEFIGVKIQDSEVQIFNFSNKSLDLHFNMKKINKIKNLIQNTVDKAYESNIEEEYNCDQSISDDSECKGDEIEILLKEALDPSHGSFDTFDCSFKIRRGILKNYIRDDLLRMKVFDDSAKIVSSYVENKNIKTFLVESISKMSGRKEKFKIHTFYSKNFIVDFCNEKKILFIYNFKMNSNVKGDSIIDQLRSDNKIQIQDKDGISNLNIIYKSSNRSLFPNSFIEYIKIRSSFEKYLIKTHKMKFERSPNELKIEGYVNKGTIFLEFKTEKEDDYSLIVFSCKKQEVFFEIYKIITNKPFTLIYPVESDYIKIRLTPKHRNNDFIDYKFKNFEYEKNILLKGSIGLNKNHKLKIKTVGYPTHVIFWEIDPLTELKRYIQDSESKNEIESNGIIRTEEREYLLIFKNKAEKKRNIEIFAGITELI